MPRPKSNDMRVGIRLPGALAEQAKQKADKEGKSLSDVIRELLRKWLGQK